MITVGICACGFGGALYEGRCYWCRDTPPPAPKPAPRTINALFSALAAELAGEVPAPLSQRLTLAALWCDLARLNGETPPAAVALIAEGLPVNLTPQALDTATAYRIGYRMAARPAPTREAYQEPA